MRPWVLFLLSLPLAAQTPSFEVASIRPGNRTNTGSLCTNLKLSQDSTLLSSVWPLNALIHDAYANEVDDFDFPQGLGSPNFAINIKVPPQTTVDMCRHMLRNLLAERFHLVTAVETRSVARYHVGIAKSGVKLKSAGSPADPDATVRIDVQNGLALHTFRNAPISRVIRAIEACAVLETRGRGLRIAGNVNSFRFASVIDETGLTGFYDGEFRFSASASLRDDLSESLEDAVVRQLGLTLELRRTPGKVLVLQSFDRTPTEN